MAGRIKVDRVSISSEDAERPVFGNLSNDAELTAAMPSAASVEQLSGPGRKGQ